MGAYPFNRVPRLYDKVEAQAEHGFRSDMSYLYRKFINNVNGTWFGQQIISNTYGWYRFGSLNQATSYVIAAWVENLAHYYYGNIRQVTVNTNFTLSNSKILSDPFSGLQEPVAVATRRKVALSGPGGESIVAYKKATGATLFVDTSTAICYRKSTNSGVSFGAEICPVGVTGSIRSGLTASYDENTQLFSIMWALDNGQLRILSIPATGGATPGALTTLAQKSFHAPSLACAPGVNSCKLVWENWDASGCLTWYEGGFSATGYFVPSLGRQQCYSAFDTPSVVFDEYDSVFRLTLGQGNYAAYAFTMSSAGGTIWTPVTDLYNNASSYISHPVMSSSMKCVGSGCTGDSTGWFFKWN